MGEFQLQRIGVVMEPEPGNPWEVEGVLNPASARGPDGQLILFPRLVAKGNYSRIGVARVLFDTAGDPKGVGFSARRWVVDPAGNRTGFSITCGCRAPPCDGRIRAWQTCLPHVQDQLTAPGPR